MSGSDAEGEMDMELPIIWQFVHPLYARNKKEDANALEEEEDEEEDDEVRRKRAAPKISRLLRYLNDMDDEEELERILQERDPVTQQTLLQWATGKQHYLLVEYLVKRLKRAAFGFPLESTEMQVYLRWEEMRPELPTAAELQMRQQLRDKARQERLAAHQREEQERRENQEEDDEEAQEEEEEEEEEDNEEFEEEENEPLPEELVYEALSEYHDEWGERGHGLVKQIGELGVYFGSRKRDGTKHGLGMALFPNGDAYAGEYDHNRRHGVGVYWWAEQGVIYAGRWHNGVRHGRGRIVYPDGSRYVGSWSRDLKHGVGHYQYADGSSYDGAWVENRKQGYGVYRFKDGSSFHGSFVDNVFTAGEWRLASGVTRYYGNFEKDAPIGAGVFVHRLGSTAHRAFQQEGFYHKGEWHPGVLYGTTRVPPRLEVVAPHQEEPRRVPMIFAPECNGGSMAELVKAANFPPLQWWLKSLVPVNLAAAYEGSGGGAAAAAAAVDNNPGNNPNTGNTHEKMCQNAGKGLGVILTSVEVCSIRYGTDDPSLVVELRIRPVLQNAAGKRLRLSPTGDETIILKERTTRLLMILEPVDRGHGSSQSTTPPMVILERGPQLTCAGPAHMQNRLPTVELTAGGTIEGAFARAIQPPLRVTLNASTITQLVRPLRSSPLHGNAEEDVIMYVQQWEPDALAKLEEKLQVASNSLLPTPLETEEATGEGGEGGEDVPAKEQAQKPPTEGITYICRPLSAVPQESQDAVTIIATTLVLRRRAKTLLPMETATKQRPPTPIPPQPEPRPELQPLFEAREAMKRAEEAGSDDDDDPAAAVATKE
ncbi:hypothetical protein, conserved [Trypanosoma brucei gambiense DAL972]|uniref:Phosphatidylinositol 4-phosphate 5-kinase n=1 Tax=Trypanosoma brucei gambiense (strain MHOM/CI/86/DAL972) TaxID=679716 RepID=C9ZU66_TRYB9|nr:hypothetical protein, conserved [Trypanosoma brucei gambiense DAL972]CBH12952.1 hypothetical protein, conserved [Trypanosoma brucei gambiense DAL972]|eukprot:XP_011775231.1 hypothetical protein, conserved [Trypanosoma brucei gambiense DAL972]